MIYATEQDYKDFTGQTAPSNFARLADKVSKIVDRLTLNRIDQDDNNHIEAAKKAVCAQIEFELSIDDNLANMDNVSSFTVGSFSMNFGGDGQTFKKLCQEAYTYLFDQGLLYRGVSS
ncbi:hypothetical protein SAMN05421676_11213 [Salinibacillus kushneri]|uniref:Phage gp6-like head-tail connector protein n=1 Tax=Salinibacillus kushneri TaxID=237682 RepID=A0A1I0IDZ2_9BACI|nr:hypothetical protein [Salinibacillus kushneri]SET94763.1 hypothetical protein SAMN05421676_11213 [Salinibacillus kushneri]